MQLRREGRRGKRSGAVLFVGKDKDMGAAKILGGELRVESIE